MARQCKDCGSENRAASAGKTRNSALPRAGPRSRNRATAGLHADASSVATADLVEELEDELQLQEALPTKRAKAEAWTCPLCNVTLTGKNVWSAKSKHLQAWHPEQRAECRMVKVCEVRPLEPGERASWKCPLCSEGLPEGVSTLNSNRARKRHLKQKHPRAKWETMMFGNHHRRGKTTKAQRKAHVQQANTGTRNAAVARRLSHLRLGKQGEHPSVVTVNWPLTKGRRKQLCTKCGKSAGTVPILGKTECALPSSPVQIAKRQQLVQRFEKLVSKAKPCEKTSIETILDILRATVKEEQP